jgi:hypothetical protein
VDSPMRRTILLALLGALLFAAPASAQGTRVEILRDCQDDGILQGDYTAAQMRDAKNNIPTELDEYSDCRDVLSRGISAKTSSNNSNNDSSNSGGSGGGPTGGSGSDGGSGGGSTDSGGSDSSSNGTESTPSPAAIPDSGRALPTTPEDWAAIHAAQQNGEHIADDLKPVSPGARLTASVGRNGLPGSLVAALALIAAAALAFFAAPLIRRRGLGTRQTS